MSTGDQSTLTPDTAGKVSYQQIPSFTEWGGYAVDHNWSWLETAVAGYVKDYGFDMGESDFQRGHVRTEAQQIAYVEHVLRGGRSGKDILCNARNWQRSGDVGQMVLVDGKQRLRAALRFLRNDLGVFGGFHRNQFTGHMSSQFATFRWHVNSLNTREQVLWWYVEINAGGTPHTAAEINKVRALIAANGKTRST